VSPSTAALSYRKPASAETSHDSCRALGHDERGTLCHKPSNIRIGLYIKIGPNKLSPIGLYIKIGPNKLSPIGLYITIGPNKLSPIGLYIKIGPNKLSPIGLYIKIGPNKLSPIGFTSK
jgi:hypothetical protein